MTRSKWNWMIAWFLFALCTLIAVPAIAQQQVQVVNGKGDPVPTLEATQPYEDSCEIYFSGSYFGSCQFRTVHLHKRLIIQEFDSYLGVEAGNQPASIVFQSVIAHYFPATLMSYSPGYTYATHQETRMYASPEGPPVCIIVLAAYSNGNAFCAVTGFLVDVL